MSRRRKPARDVEAMLELYKSVAFSASDLKDLAADAARLALAELFEASARARDRLLEDLARTSPALAPPARRRGGRR